MSLVAHFAKLEDPRIERKKLHSLIDIMVLSICVIVSGAEGWQGIVDFGHEKLEWLRRFIPLTNGVPSHDCIAYVFARLSPEGFRGCFISWVEGVREKTEGEVIAIDGKTSRGSRDRKLGKSPLHRVSAWACANRLVLGQEATAEKSNEITAIPKRFAHAVRAHWGIENRLHWRLDVVMREDDCRIKKDNSPAVMAMVRHLTLNLFENIPAKLSLKQKRFKAALSDEFREQVIFGQKF